MTVQFLILRHENPLERAQRYVPLYIFLGAFSMTLVTILKGLSHVGLTISTQNSYLLATAIAVTVAIIGGIAVRRIKPDPKAEKEHHFTSH